jgi:signal transduction histidine kinase
MSTLVEAELARTREDLGAAMVLYDAAIDAAAEHGFIKVETIAHELTAAFWIGCGKPQFAAVHLGKARDLCEHWGARPRAAALERRRRGLGAPTSNNYATMRSTTAVTSTLDFATVVKASQAITSDIVLDSLLVKIMDIIIENTGAQTGSIILESNGELRVHASTHDGKAVRVTGGVPVATAPDVSRGIVTYVTRTAECVVLDDATRHPSFRADPYVRERRPRSVLCLPIVHKERMIGAVYLENNLVVGAFTVDRLEALGILVAQLAISIENAVMFSRLEELVTERTQALTEANEQLREQAVVRERMESQLRLAQKLESVGQLAAGIAHEINTPIQFVGDSVTFLQDGLDSLLGFIDAYRASIGAATGSVDLDKFDVDYLRENMPAACARALEGVQRVSKIVCAMMVFAHPDRQEQQPTKLNAVLENTLVMSRNEYCRIADVETDLADIPEVLCHAGEVSQVLLNLVINAAHAIEELGAKERGKISIATRVEDDMVVVSITDTGGGIPEAIRDRIFDPFFTTKDVGRGTGQGLTLARTAIVDRHGGRLDFETRLGLGTTFFVRLPIRGRTAIAIVDHSGHVARTGSPATMS